MKIKWNKKYTTIAVYSLIVIMLAVLFVVFVFKFDSFKSGFSWIGSVSAPLICGIVIAYIVNPLMMWIERTFFHKLVENPPPEKGIVMQKLAESKVGSTAVSARSKSMVPRWRRSHAAVRSRHARFR